MNRAAFEEILDRHLIQMQEETGRPAKEVIFAYLGLLLRHDNPEGSNRAAILGVPGLLNGRGVAAQPMPAVQAAGLVGKQDNVRDPTFDNGHMRPVAQGLPVPIGLAAAAPVAQNPASTAAPIVSAPAAAAVPANSVPNNRVRAAQASGAQANSANVGIVRLFRCRFCHKRFTRQSSANRHERSHH